MSSNDTERNTARPRFFKKPVQNKAASEKEGRPIFDEKEMVEVKFPGDKQTVAVFPVEDKHRKRWPKHYEAFQAGQERAAIGTPLEAWPILTSSRVAELKAMGILSVDEYADVTDGTLTKLGMNARAEREKARAFLAAAKDGASTAAMAAELARLKEMVERLMQGAVVQAEATDKPLEDCTDAELKTFIKRESGEGVRGNPSRDTLLAKAAELANRQSEAA